MTERGEWRRASNFAGDGVGLWHWHPGPGDHLACTPLVYTEGGGWPPPSDGSGRCSECVRLAEEAQR